MSKKLIYLIIIIILMFGGLRILLLNINPYVSSDEAVYLSMSEYLTKLPYGNIGGPVASEYHRPPALTYFLSPFSQLNSERVAIPLLSLLLIIIVYLVSKDWFGKELALFSTLFLATNHLILFFSFRILPEILFSVLIVISLFLFYKSLNNAILFPLVGFFTGLTILTRYTGIILIPIYFIWILFNKREIFGNRKFYLGIFAFILTLLPWLIFNLGSGGIASSAVRQFPLYKLNQISLLLAPRSLLAFGFLLPFLAIFLYALYKKPDKRASFILFGFLLFVLLQEPIMDSVRYVTALVPLIGIILAYSLIGSRPALKGLFIILCILNGLIGLQFINAYSIPLEESNIFTGLINKDSLYTENKEYYEAAEVLKSASAESETILIDGGGHFVWYYSGRKWVHLANYTNINKFKHAYIVTLEHNKTYDIPNELKDWQVKYNGKFVKVLEND